ncbi:FERM, ARHGEF and pleckstrin domain-containing protein 2 [Schistosoma japonicum]|nr:FERM, ARHGEF and pleckstrin domain-containing protein 2 [Schistosoma japonicum]
MPCWLDHNKTIIRQYSSSQDFIYRFSVKFYTPHPNLLEEAYTRYLFALQIKRDLVTGTLLCSENTAALLASYIVQAEIGDFIKEEHRTISYLKSLKLLYEPNDERLRRVREFHKSHIGLSPTEADFALLDTARKIEFYGVRLHFARDHEGLALNLAVTHLGLLVFKNLIKINTFSWAKIRKLSFKRKRFLVKLHPDTYDTIEFIFDSRDECKQFWKKSIEHHTFFRCTYLDRKLQKRSRLASSGSSFRYTRRTEQELQEYVQRNCEKRTQFERPSAARQTSLSKTNEPTYSTRKLNSVSLTLRSSSADRRNFMSGNINGSFSGTFGKQPALKRAQSMGVNAMSRNQQEVDGSSTNVHLPITTLPTSGYSTMSESVTGSGRSSHPKNIEDLEEHESNDLQSSPKNELERRMTGDWSGDNQAKQPEEDVSSRAWKSEAGSPGQSAVASLCKLNLELDAFLSSRDDQISLSDRQNHGESEGMEEDAANRQSSNKSTQFVDLLHDGSLRGYLFSSTPSFDQNNERLPDLSSFKPSEHQLNDYSTSRSFNLIETPIFDSGDHPSWSLSLTSKIMSSHPDSLHRSEFSQPPPKPRRASQVLTTREEDSLTLTSEPIQFERNTIMEPSLGEIIQLHMDRAKLINPISTSTSVLLESPGPMLNISTNNNTVDSTYVSNITTTNQSGSRPYEAALILPTVTQLGLEINLDKELSFLRTTSVLSITTNNTTSSTASVCNNLPILDETSTIFDNNTSKTMNLSVFPNLSIKPQTISSSITIPPFTASISLITSSPTSTTFVTYPTSVTTTKGTYSLLGDEQMLSPDHSILYDFLPHDDAFSVTLNDISILKSTETREKVETDSQLPRSETESSRVQLSDFLQTFGLTSSSNEPIDLVKSIIKPTENESYGCLFLDDLVSKSPQFSTTSTTQTTACDTSAVSVTITTTNAYPAKTKSHLATTLSEESKTHNSLFSHFNASTSHFSVGSEPVHVASLDQWSSSSSESTTGVIIRSDLASHTSPTCHHSVPCINSVNPMLQHSLACPHALKSMHLGQVSNYSHPSEVDVKSTNFMTDYKIMNNVKNVTSHNNVVKTKHHKHLQNHEHICSHGHHLSNSIPNNIHLTELEEAVPSASNHICNMITGDNIKRIHRKRSDSKKSEQMRRSKHIHHIHDQIDHVSSRNQDLIPLNDLETAAEMLEEVPYVVLRRPRSVDVKQYQLHLEHQRQKAAALAAATGGYPFHLYQTPAAHYPFTSRLPTSSRFSYGPYVQPPHFHGFGGNECNQSHYVDTPVTFGTLHKSEQSSKQKTHKSSNRSKHMSSKGDSDSCKGYSKRTHSRSRKETRLPATEEIDHFLKHDLKSNPYSSSNQITTNNLPTQTTSAYSHYRHHDHCLHKRSEVPSTGKADGIPGERKSKSSPPTNNVTTISTKTDLDNQDKNIEYDKNLAKGRETITSSSFLSTAVSSTTTTTGIAKPKSQYSDLHQPQPSTSMQNKKNKTVTPLITTETQQLKQILSLDGREENGESEMPYPVSVSAVKPVPKLKATSKSINRHPTHEHSQHPLPPPYWYYHGNEQQPQQFHHHHHHPACASLIGKRETSARSARDQTQPTIYGSEFLATNYPHIFTKSLKPHGVDKSELRVTSTKKKVTSKPLSLPSDQLKSKIVQDFVDNSKESEEKNVKQAKTLKVKSYSDERGRADMDPNETFEKLREDLRSAGFTVDTNSPYSSTTKSKDNKQSTHSYSKETKKVGDKTQLQSKPKRTDVTSDRVMSSQHSSLITSSPMSTTTTTPATATPTITTTDAVPSQLIQFNTIEESKLASCTENVDISNLIPTFELASSVHPRTTIYLDSESEEEIVKNGKCTITEKFVEGPGTKESKAFKKQVEEWIEKSQAAYTKDDASNNTDIQILPKEDDHRMEINDVIDVDLDHSVEVKPHLSAKHHQTNVNHHSPRSHSPSLPLSCHSIEPESTDLSFCSNLSTSGSSYSMLSGHDYSLSTNCSCEHFQKHGYDDFILSSCTSSCEYSHHAHRFHHSRPSSTRKHYSHYRHQPCNCHYCSVRLRDNHYKRHASEHQDHRHKYPERHRSHHSDHHRYHSYSRHSSGKRSSAYYPHHHDHHHRHHKIHKHHSNEFSDGKYESTTSSSKSLEEISLDENVLLKSYLDYSSSVISPEKLKDVKNSQKELLSNLKSQERKLKQELAKHRALTEKLVKVKRYNEKLLTIENISLSNPILNTEKSKGNYVVDDDKHGVGVSTTAVICDDTTTNINSLLTTQSAINQGTHLSKEHKSSDDEKEEPRRHSQHPKNLSRLSSHTKSRSRSGHRSTSRRRLQKQTEHDQKQSTDIHKTTHAPKIKSSQILDTSINKEPKESPGDGINSVNPESSASQRKKERKDVKKQEPQKHRSKHVTHYKHHHDHHRHKHNELHESNEKTAITEKTSKVLSGLQESNRIKAEQSSLSTAFEDNKEPNIADNLLIITNKAALDYQDNEQSPMHKQSDIKLIPISSATTSLISITNQSEKQIHQSTPSHSTNSVDTTTVKCNLEVINEKQDNEQSSSSQSLSNDDDKQMTIRTQTSSNYENLDISTIGRKEEDESLQLVSDKTDELPPIPPTCPPPIVYTIPPVTDRIDESADIMVKQAIDLLDEVVAESTRCIDNDAQSRTLSSINRCLEYSSSEQVMLGDDNEYNGTRIPNILDNDENQSNIVATSDTNLHSGTVTQFIKEENKNEISDRPCSPCESTTSASEGSEDIEPFPPPPPAEVLAEVIEEEPSPNIDVVEEEDEEENDEDDGEEERRKSSSVSTVIEVYLPVTSVVSSMQSNDDYETTENKLAPSNEQVEKHAHISDEPNDDDTTISESVRSVENDEFSNELSAEITPPPDCEKSKIKVTDESSLLDKTLKSNLPLTE